ncbi:MAG: DUF1538 domain-containing protein [Gammaproteobacteria bacterium]|nr:DUF1538 domain-containing protein [Gammaproteobacteria bacterium]
MTREIRFGDFVREIGIEQQELSFNAIAPVIRQDDDGKDLPHRPARLKIRPIDTYHLVKPYVQVRLVEQVRAVVPLAVYLALFQLLILKQNVTDSWVITGGLLAVIVGLMLFMEGLKVGLMPFGQSIGSSLPAKSSLAVVLFVVFLLGIGVTFAEPAIGALKAAGSIVRPEGAPYLYALLNDWAEVLVLVVGVGVGLAAVLGTIRFLFGWSLKPFIYLTLTPLIALTAYIAFDPELSKTLGLAWDSGAVTTGPVTVPLVLALGIGISAAAGKGHSSLSGFGIVTLASLFPIIAVQGLALYVASVESPEQILRAAAEVTGADSTPWHANTPVAEIIAGVRAIVPLVLFLVLIMTLLLKERIRQRNIIAYGISLCVIGMILFNLGLSYGLAKLGSQSGGLVPAAFSSHEFVSASPLYGYALGMIIAVLFAWLLGFGATLAEPALNALGMTVEDLTNGAFRKSMLMYSVSFGVGCGIAVGVLKIVFDVPIAWLLIPGYGVAAVLTALSSEEFVNVAWDSAGVTTGPVTVPLVLAMGLGFGDAVGAIEGFGILSMASIGPIVAVLTTGLWIQMKVRKRHEEEDAATEGPAAAKP